LLVRERWNWNPDERIADALATQVNASAREVSVPILLDFRPAHGVGMTQAVKKPSQKGMEADRRQRRQVQRFAQPRVAALR
jgi:hypothetical protein